MAVSRFSNIFQTEDYVKPFDLSTYATLIGERQRLYDTNFKALSSQLTKYTNIPVSRPVDKDYIGNKIQNLNQNVNAIGAVDYSDPNNVARINSMITGFAEDPRIKNALLSSNAMMQDRNKIEELKKSKEYTVQNEWPVLKAMDEYMKSQDENAVYSSVNVKPYKRDSFSEVIKLAKDFQTTKTISLPTIGPDGQQRMVEFKQENLTAQDVETGVRLLMTPDDIAQADIDAQWTYRGITPDMTDESSQAFVSKYYSNRLRKDQNYWLNFKDKQLKLLADPSIKAEDKNNIQNQLDAADKKIELLTNQLNNPDYILSEGSKKGMFEQLKNEAYMDMRLEQIGLLMSVHNEDISGLGSSKGSGGSTGQIEITASTNFSMAPADETQTGLQTKNAILGAYNNIDLQLGNEKKLGAMTKAVLTNLRNQDPALASKSDAELMVVYKEKERLYKLGQLGENDATIRQHFDDVSSMKSQKYVMTQIIKKADDRLKAMPEYVKANNGLKASEKQLKDFYDIPVQIGQKIVTKRYPKQAVLNYMQALEMIGLVPGRDYGGGPMNILNNPSDIAGNLINLATQKPLVGAAKAVINEYANSPLLDTKTVLPTFNSGNELINDVNKGLKEMDVIKATQGDFSRDGVDAFRYNANRAFNYLARPIRPSYYFTAKGQMSYDYVDPVHTLSLTDPTFAKHLDVRREFSKTVRDNEDRVYKELGYAQLIPTFAPSDEQKVQDNYKNLVYNLIGQYDKENKDRKILSWTGIKARPDGYLDISYTFKSGQDEGSDVVSVPRSADNTFSQMLPENKWSDYQAGINLVGHTSDVVDQAPVMSWGSVVIPYRVYPKNGGYQVQVFENGVLNTTESPDLWFKSIATLEQNKSAMARKIAEARARNKQR